jgi:hypothetical protein
MAYVRAMIFEFRRTNKLLNVATHLFIEWINFTEPEADVLLSSDVHSANWNILDK